MPPLASPKFHNFLRMGRKTTTNNDTTGGELNQARKPHDGRTPGNHRPQPYHQGAALDAVSGALDWLTRRSEEERT